ncbi:hypothetical protein FANTH_1615 [Fusarium anthophilum]|uniref:NACHT domain-containing protein n=1 Tax=Fusarium anthophilum TaxID=48485 RepID=A0A8H4ZVJ4_9HYPO|nr:hypothetical protein FANTH_1615 [Fusarium anthophilum]
MPELGGYTIGWICALTKELIAAKAFLDVLHDPVDNAAINDDNKYTLGSIGKHNVVIAVLPYGQYGLVNAATALKDMTRTFSNLRAVLMVGIGGGVPGGKDIRLGDIVVGSVGRNSSGVIQYDYGRAVQGEEFTVTGHLNQPPLAFLTAMSALHATYQMEGHSIESNIDKALQKYKRLSKKYKRPAASTDRLYKADAIHQGGEGTVCSESCSVDKLLHRDERGEDENNPAIHCGLIASGNCLIKDALLRDKLATKHGILCFEMEAAGLMNHFPDEWQEYAAMAAAAYTKDLLLEVAPSSVQKEERIETVLGQINDKIEGIRHIATESNRDIKFLSSIVHDDAISRWLSPSDASVDHNKAREAYHSGTGQWLLNNPQYLHWKSQKNSFLWLNGNSGTGKTILSSTVIEDIRGSGCPQFGNRTIVYFYITFSDNQKQSLDAILRSLINQLYHGRPECRHPITSLHSKCSGGSSQATIEQLKFTFRDMLSAAGEVFVLIDALDEYRNRSAERDELLAWVESFRNGPGNTHLLVTSRPDHDIKTSIESWAGSESINSLKSDDVCRDISEYVRDSVANSTSFRRWNGRGSTQEDIVAALTTKADGVFRWVALQLERLKNCINKEEIDETLQTLPNTLKETYYRVLHDLKGTRRKYVIRVLQFLAYSNFPMDLEAAVDVLAINLTAPPGSRFIMAEQLFSNRLLFERWRTLIEETFNRKIFIHRRALRTRDLSKEDEVFYASWSGDQTCVKKLLDDRRDTTAWNLENALHFASSFGHLETVAILIQEGADFNAKGEIPNVLCTAVEAGHKDVIALLINGGADINPRGEYRSPLEIASGSGRLDIIKLLIKQPADDKTQENYAAALSAASGSGNLRIVQSLLEKGSDLNANLCCTNALYSASDCGHLNIVMHLVEKGADVNADADSGTALSAACRSGHLNIVQFLLEKGAVVNARVGENNSTLRYACKYGHLDIVDYLLQNGADIKAQGGEYGTALRAAVVCGSLDIVKHLIRNGALD